MRGFRRAYKRGEGGGGRGAYDRMYFLFTGRWSFNSGGRGACTWQGGGLYERKFRVLCQTVVSAFSTTSALTAAA